MPLLDLADTARVAPRPFSSFLEGAPGLYMKEERLIMSTDARHLGAKAYDKLSELEEHGGIDFRWLWQSWAVLMELFSRQQPYALAAIAEGVRQRSHYEVNLLNYPERAQWAHELLAEVHRAMPSEGEAYCREVHLFLTELQHYLGQQEPALQRRLRTELFATRAPERLSLHDATRKAIEKYEGTHIVFSPENNRGQKTSLLGRLDSWEVRALLA